MRNKKIFFISICFSLCAHILFFVFSSGIHVQGMYRDFPLPKRTFDIKTLQSDIPPIPIFEESQTFGSDEIIKFESPMYSQLIVSYENEQRRQVAKKELKITRDEKRVPVSVSQEQYNQYLKESNKDFDIFKSTVERRTREEMVSVDAQAGREDIVRPEEIIGKDEISEEFLDKMPGFTPDNIGGVVEAIKRDLYASFSRSYKPAVKRKGNLSSLRHYFVSETSVYQDPDDGEKYFRIVIRSGKDAFRIPSIPKEIVFLVDASSSIKEKRIEQLKKGLSYCLNNLNPGDHFNIIAFKERIILFRPLTVKPIQENIEAALRFVSSLRAGERTDTYSALLKCINVEYPLLPSYILLFSDGIPTQGVKNSAKIIDEISKLNNGKISIFAFSGGVRVNRYLLDFISFKNRGWTEYAQRTHFIARDLARMYDKIKDPLLLNIRYYVTGLEGREMFPKKLPDLFRNAEFTLYGKYTDEDKFLLQLLGDLDEKTNEFVIEGSLSDAALGDREIAKNWAHNKIYYLISLLGSEEDNPEVIKKINYLCNKFKIRTPYLRRVK